MIALQNDVSSARAAASPPPSGAGCGRRARATRTWPSSNPPWGPGTTATPCRAHPDSVRDLQPGLAAPRRRRALPAAPPPSGAGTGQRRARLLEGDDPGWFPDPQALALRPDGDGPGSHSRGAPALGRRPAGWRWERVHLAHWRHPLSDATTAALFDLGPAPVDGCADTLRNTGLSFRERRKRGRVPPGGGLLPAGPLPGLPERRQLGAAGSPHYGDGFAPWIAGEYHVVHLRREAVEADLEGRTLLRPTGAGGLASRPAHGALSPTGAG